MPIYGTNYNTICMSEGIEIRKSIEKKLNAKLKFIIRTKENFIH